MSTDDKKKNTPEKDSLAELMNAFGGYSDDVDEEPIDVLLVDGGGDAEKPAPAERSEVKTPKHRTAKPDDVVDAGSGVTYVPDDILSMMNGGVTEPEDPAKSEPAPEPIPPKKAKKIRDPGLIFDDEIPADESLLILNSAVKDVPPGEIKPANDPAVPENPAVESAKIGGAAVADIPVPEAETPSEPEPEPVKKPAKKTEKKKEPKPATAKAEPKEPKPEKEPEETPEPEKPVSFTSAGLVVTLTLICAAVALLLGAVNHVTALKIAENIQKEKLISIREIFDETVQADEITPPEGSGLTSVYLVIRNGGVCGYSASVAPAGFGGPIELMIGMDSTGKVVGVDVVSMSETPGLGSKAGNGDFLGQFIGKSGEVGVDAISGATISSEAVAAGVNAVTNNLLDIYVLAAEHGMTVVPYDPTDVPVTTAPATEPPATETEEPAAVPEAPVTTAPAETTALAVPPVVSKGDSPPQIIVDNPNNENPGVDADYKEDTTEFETLTTEPETSETEETEEE